MRALLLLAILGSIAVAAPTLATRFDAKTLSRELAKLQTKAKFTRAIDPAQCVQTSDTAFQCSETVCPGACQVRRNEATIQVRNGVWSVTATTAKQLGDTGACGCCM